MYYFSGILRAKKTANNLIQRTFKPGVAFAKKTAKATPALKAPDEGVRAKNMMAKITTAPSNEQDLKS